MLTETEKAYLAGFLDADGCIFINRGTVKEGATPYYRLSVIFSQADKAPLEYWCDKAGVGRVYLQTKAGTQRPTGLRNTKDFYQWHIYAAEAEAILHWLLPYLHIKRDQAVIALQFRKTMLSQGGQGRTPTPPSVVELREHYRQQLIAAKKGALDPDAVPSDVDDLGLACASQLTLF